MFQGLAWAFCFPVAAIDMFPLFDLTASVWVQFEIVAFTKEVVILHSRPELPAIRGDGMPAKRPML